MHFRNRFPPAVSLIPVMIMLMTGINHNPVIAQRKKPNVVIIMSDDQGWGDLSMNGNTNLRTPNIDKISRNGATFSHFYVSPVCSPTRAELLTGRYHPRLGVYSTSEGGERLNLDETTIAQVFRKAGYATAAFGKWHNGMQYPYHPNARGFDEFYGFCSGHWGNYFSPLLEHNGSIVQGSGFIIDDLTEKALDFIQKNKDDPFLLYLPYNTPHSPMQVPDKEWDKFKNKTLSNVADARTGPENIDFTRAALALSENIDRNVGRVQDRLKQLNLEKETILIYLSDNGPNSSRWNGGLKGRKGSTDEGGVKSPFVIQWPGKISANLQIRNIAGAIDLLPTLADLADINYDVVKPLDGKSLKPLLMQTARQWPDRMLFSHWNGKIAVRMQHHILDHEGQLFDLDEDPGQRSDISAKNPALTKALSKSVADWKKDVFKGLGQDSRPFPVGHSDFRYTHLPARDGKAHGGVKRSSKHPNSSYFTNFSKVEDYISWDIDVLVSGDFAVQVYYTCAPEETGSSLKLKFGTDELYFKIAEENHSEVLNQKYDRVEREESYEKDFKPMEAGVIHLKKGRGTLILQPTSISKSNAMDFRLIMLTRIGGKF